MNLNEARLLGHLLLRGGTPVQTIRDREGQSRTIFRKPHAFVGRERVRNRAREKAKRHVWP